MRSKRNRQRRAVPPVPTSVPTSRGEVGTADQVEVGRRITEARGRLTQDEFAEQLGVHANTLGRYERGIRMPDVAFINALASRADVNPIWLLRGEPPRSFRQSAGDQPDERWSSIPLVAREGEASRYEIEHPGRDTVYVKLYDVHVGGGTGRVPEHERVAAVRAFSAAWLSARFNATEADVYLVSVTGDSMAPLICDGDLILVDRRERDLRRDDIYVIRMDEALLVKNVQLLPGGQVRIWSENEKVSAPFTVNVHDQALAPGFEVIGRVLWRGGTLRR